MSGRDAHPISRPTTKGLRVDLADALKSQSARFQLQPSAISELKQVYGLGSKTTTFAYPGSENHVRLARTIVDKHGGLPENSSLAFSTLDSGEPYNVPLSDISASGPMGDAGGLPSTANDLAKYCRVLVRSWHNQAQPGISGKGLPCERKTRGQVR